MANEDEEAHDIENANKSVVANDAVEAIHEEEKTAEAVMNVKVSEQLCRDVEFIPICTKIRHINCLNPNN